MRRGCQALRQEGKAGPAQAQQRARGWLTQHRPGPRGEDGLPMPRHRNVLEARKRERARTQERALDKGKRDPPGQRLWPSFLQPTRVIWPLLPVTLEPPELGLLLRCPHPHLVSPLLPPSRPCTWQTLAYEGEGSHLLPILRSEGSPPSVHQRLPSLPMDTEGGDVSFPGDTAAGSSLCLPPPHPPGFLPIGRWRRAGRP